MNCNECKQELIKNLIDNGITYELAFDFAYFESECCCCERA